MKPKIVSLIAVLICVAIFLVVGLFGYWRFKVTQTANAAFRQQLQTGAQQGALGVNLPGDPPDHPGGGQ